MTQSLLPSSDLNTLNTTSNSTYPSKTWLVNSEGRIVGLTNGKQAIQQSIQAMLSTSRYDYLIYSWNYGHELNKLIGKDKAYIEVEAPRLIKECLTQDDRISNVSNFVFTSAEDGLLIEFEVTTTEGTIESEVKI